MKLTWLPTLLVVFAFLETGRGEIPFNETGFVLEGTRRGGRDALAVDGLMYHLARHGLRAPRAGDEVPSPGGENVSWTAARFVEGRLEVSRNEGRGQDRRRRRGGGSILLTAHCHEETTALLHAGGHASVCVNGAWRTGDVYGNQSVPLPLLLEPGENTFLFTRGRGGELEARLEETVPTVLIHRGDVTLPDFVDSDGNDETRWGAIVLINTSARRRRDLELVVGETVTACGAIPPASFRKVGFQMRLPSGASADERPITLVLRSKEDEETLAEESFSVRVRRPDQTRRVTFVSDIDASVQYYGLTPAVSDSATADKPGLVLSLHGAGVEAVNQAGCYKPKDWVHVVAPTNRRPYGFDWEDWGRLDALEVLAHARETLDPDRRRHYLTGHSMGGHGTWQLGAHYPDQFAAIGPSAGWISFQSYGGGRRRETEPSENAVEAVFSRAVSASDTLALSSNYEHFGIYILHGDNDRSVPVSQARTMREHLAGFHPNFSYYEQAGAGHWWGNQCMDWPRMFAYFREHRLPNPGDVQDVSYKTAHPGISSSCHWVTIEAQQIPMQTSGVEIGYDEENRRFSGATENVARLSLDISHLPPGGPLSVEVDGQILENLQSPAGTHRVWLRREGSAWEQSGRPDAAVKGPQRSGPFKDAFRNRMIFVYGTAGSEEETAWSFAKARFDAESFWYRGNGSVEILPDSDFQAEDWSDRNVILYGNADTNRAWEGLLGEAPIQVENGAIVLSGEELETYTGEDLTCLFVYPRRDSDIASVGVVAGTGMPGNRAADGLPYFMSGVAYPDFTVMRTSVLVDGNEGVLRAGFFRNDWSLPAAPEGESAVGDELSR